LERCLHLGQTFGAGAPVICLQRWRNRGVEILSKTARLVPNPPRIPNPLSCRRHAGALRASLRS
jgi:hypothetical protein